MYRQKLLEVGIPADVRGFEYLNAALMMYEPCMPRMKLYAELAEKYNTSPSRVERAMRHALTFAPKTMPLGRFIAAYKILWEVNYENSTIASNQ